jgi:glycosyltransferase involved in cell wall biosynthesis
MINQEGGVRIKNKEIASSAPVLSIITVVYNGMNYLEQTLKSVFAQTYQHYEYILVDGGSTDGTLDIIKQNEDRISYWISEKDNGIYDAMNKGIALARGQYVFFLNADDYLTEDTVLEDVMKQMTEDADGYCGYINFVDQAGVKLYRQGPREGDLYAYVMHQGFIYKRSLHDYMLYNTTYKVNADYDFYLNMLLKKCNFLYGDIVISNMRVDGTSGNLGFISAAETLHIHLRNRLPVFKSITKFQIKLLRLLMRRVVGFIGGDFLIRLYRKNRIK